MAFAKAAVTSDRKELEGRTGYRLSIERKSKNTNGGCHERAVGDEIDRLVYAADQKTCDHLIVLLSVPNQPDSRLNAA